MFALKRCGCQVFHRRYRFQNSRGGLQLAILDDLPAPCPDSCDT
jgi:hypothetical protein